MRMIVYSILISLSTVFLSVNSIYACLQLRLLILVQLVRAAANNSQRMRSNRELIQ